MYAFVVLKYEAPLERILQTTDRHRAWLRTLHEAGTLLASGPFVPRVGGGFLMRVTDEAHLRAILAQDPYDQEKLVSHTIHVWAPNIGEQGLDSLPLKS